MPLLLSQCLFAYTATRFFSVTSFSFLMNPLLHKSPQSSQNSSSASFSVSLKETIMVFFFFWVKNSCRALHCHRAMADPFFFLFFFLGKKLLQSITLSLCSGCSFLLPLLFFFFGQKNFIEALIAEMKFSLEIIQNIDASSTFDRMLWLKLQQWWFGAVSL